MFDFDRIEDWGPELAAAVAGLVPGSAGAALAARRPETMQDARDSLFTEIGVDRLALEAAVAKWIGGRDLAAYHGSRLTPEEAAAVRRDGLRRLRAANRIERLRAILSADPGWPLVAARLEAVAADIGGGERRGGREGQVHATLSRGALLHAFDHYLTHGAEFDQHVAVELLAEERALPLLAAHGQPVLFRLRIPGTAALRAANRHGTFPGQTPNLVREIVQAWALWLADPGLSSATLGIDCGLVFEADVPAAWLVGTEWR